jgi:hypothetical protein
MADGEDELPPIIDLSVRRQQYCGHKPHGHPILVNQYARTVECHCGALLDPFEVLLDVANEHEHRVYRLRELRRLTKETEERLAALKREEANARARLERLGIKLRAASSTVEMP